MAAAAAATAAAAAAAATAAAAAAAAAEAAAAEGAAKAAVKEPSPSLASAFVGMVGGGGRIDGGGGRADGGAGVLCPLCPFRQSSDTSAASMGVVDAVVADTASPSLSTDGEGGGGRDVCCLEAAVGPPEVFRTWAVGGGGGGGGSAGGGCGDGVECARELV